MTDTLSVTGLFLEGLLSFFSPCVFPLIPLLIGYLSAGEEEQDVRKRRVKTSVSIFFFTFGICTVFFLMAMGSDLLGRVLNRYSLFFRIAGGLLLILFGLSAAGVIKISFFQKDYRLNQQMKRPQNGLQAYLMGFFFSFAWTPCNGPLLASAVLMAASSADRMQGYFYIGAYCFGFILMFLLLGLFTGEVLTIIEKNKSVVRYTQIAGGIIVLLMGGYMLYGAAVSYRNPAQNSEQTIGTVDDGRTDLEKYGFALPDEDGNLIDIRDYKGDTILVNFFGTWCHYCNLLVPELNETAKDRENLRIFLIAAPNDGREGSKESVMKYMRDHGYTLTVLYDTDFTVTRTYGVSGYPTTFFFQPDGKFYGYLPGYVDKRQLYMHIADASANSSSKEQ